MSLIYDYLKLQGKIDSAGDSAGDSAVGIPPALQQAGSKWRFESITERFSSRTVLIIFGSCLLGILFLYFAVRQFIFEETVQPDAVTVSIPEMQVRPGPPPRAPESEAVVRQQGEPASAPAERSAEPVEQAAVPAGEAVRYAPVSESRVAEEDEPIQPDVFPAGEQSGPILKKMPQTLELAESGRKIKFSEDVSVILESRQPADRQPTGRLFHDAVDTQEGTYQPQESHDTVDDVPYPAGQESIADKTFYQPAEPAADTRNIGRKFYQAGLHAQQAGEQRDAEIYYNKALEEMPHHLETMINLSALYVQQQRYAEAEDMLADILRIDPANSKALVNMGVINLYRYNDPLAEEQFLAALAVNPLEENALVNLAYLAEKRQDYEATEKYYRQLLQISPDNVEVLLSYGHLLEIEQRYEEAVALYRDCLKLDTVRRNELLYERITQRVRLLKGAGKK